MAFSIKLSRAAISALVAPPVAPFNANWVVSVATVRVNAVLPNALVWKWRRKINSLKIL